MPRPHKAHRRKPFSGHSIASRLPGFRVRLDSSCKHEPPCQPRAPVNPRKRRFRSGILGLQRESWGFMLHPGGTLLKRRLRADNYLQNVWDKWAVQKRSCQPGRWSDSRPPGRWLPKISVSNRFLRGGGGRVVFSIGLNSFQLENCPGLGRSGCPRCAASAQSLQTELCRGGAGQERSGKVGSLAALLASE
jgi:hypothetical protein